MLPSFTNYSNQAALDTNTPGVNSGAGYDLVNTSPTTPFPDYAVQDPWAKLTANQRMVYDPILRDVYRENSIYARYTHFEMNLGAQNAPVMQFTQLMDIHPNFNPIGLRDTGINASAIATRALQITFARYAGKVSYAKFDPIVTYWRENKDASYVDAVRPILQGKLGQSIVDVNDYLSRNALLGLPFNLYANGGSSFNDINNTATATVGDLSQIHLGMANRLVPYTQDPDANYGMVTCITSPSVIYDLRKNSSPKDWLVPLAYADPQRLLRYEVGSIENVRFVQTPRATLFNCGPIIVQAAVTQPLYAGDGSPGPGAPSGLLTKSDSTYINGQPGQSTAYILLGNASAGDMASFQVGDRITVHTQRTSTNGVTNGVDYRDGTAINRRIVAIDATNKRIQLEMPVMLDYTVDLTGGGIYAYVTKAVNVHSMIFLGGADAIACGVAAPPRFYAPPPIDDFQSVYRFTWDSFMGYQTYNPAVAEIMFVGGTYREVGAINTSQ
jgi:hypothetical protein